MDDEVEDSGKSEFNFVNLFSLRVWYSAMFIGFIAGMIPTALMTLVGLRSIAAVGWVLTPIVSVIVVYNFCLEPPVLCPACGKRVKLRHSVCHHCGHDSAKDS